MEKLTNYGEGKRALASLLLLLGFVMGPVMAAQATLIGVSSSDPGKVYDVSPSTGAATELVSTSRTSYTGATFLGGDLFVSDVWSGSSYETGTVDLGTGTYTFVSDQGGSWDWHGLASDESAGLIYSIDIDNGNVLKSMTAAGWITTIGTGAGIDGRGMAFDDTHNILYATGSGPLGRILATVDTVLGTSSLINYTGLSSSNYYEGLAYDEVSGILYLTSSTAGGVSSLYTVNVTTGLATLVGSTGVVRLDGLAWKANGVPEPATLALLGAGLAGLGFSRRRKSA